MTSMQVRNNNNNIDSQFFEQTAIATTTMKKTNINIMRHIQQKTIAGNNNNNNEAENRSPRQITKHLRDEDEATGNDGRAMRDDIVHGEDDEPTMTFDSLSIIEKNDNKKKRSPCDYESAIPDRTIEKPQLKRRKVTHHYQEEPTNNFVIGNHITYNLSHHCIGQVNDFAWDRGVSPQAAMLWTLIQPQN